MTTPMTPSNISRTLAGLALGLAVFAPTEAVELKDFLQLARPVPTLELRYGQAPSQAIDVFLPPGAGPHPVAILIHGGCWAELPGATREQLRPLAARWAGLGIAVWSIGYRRANEAGGGYPAMYRDVAMAVDRIGVDGPPLGIDVARSVLVGHSAGGHLALWAASRASLPAGSPLRQPAEPLPVRAVISVAGIGDLEKFSPAIPATCGPGVLEGLAGPGADRFADVSPARLVLPPVVRSVVMVSAAGDKLVPLQAARDYRDAQPAAAARIRLRDVAQAGHFDLVTPGAPAAEVVLQEVRQALEEPAATR
jgi:acetyl esterase/lipase